MSNDDSDPNDRSRLWVIRLSKNLMKKSIVNGGNGEKKAIVLAERKLAFKDDKIKSNANSNSRVNEGYCIHNIKLRFLFLIK